MKALPICERKANLGNKSNMCGLLDLVIHPKEYIYLTLHLEILVDNYSRSKSQVFRDWVLIYNLLIYHLVSKKIKKKGI